LLWAGELESVTVSEKFAVPAAVGVPESFQFVPEPLRVNHPGSVDPVATVQVYGDVPPDAWSDALKATPTVALGKLVVVMLRPTLLMTRVNC